MPQEPLPPMKDDPMDIPSTPPMGTEPPIGDVPPMPTKLPVEDKPSMGDGPSNNGSQATSEIEEIFSELNTEQRAATIKYAKSMTNNNQSDSSPMPPMATEGKKYLQAVINEIVNNIINNEESQEEVDMQDKKIRNRKVTVNNPNISNR